MPQTPPGPPLIRAALVYDFDGTLARGNIQEHTFLPDLGIDKQTFWDEVGQLKQQHDADQILIYMWRMLEAARARGVPVTQNLLRDHGRNTLFYDGVSTWFDRINGYGAKLNLVIDHYIVSSGNYEMIEGCSIFPSFRRVFASRFIYDQQGHAVWPAVAINYTTKTQFLFRINKGVDNNWDDAAVNRWQPMDERPMPFTRMIFIGDGDTDIPSMKMVRHQGGHSVAVFDERDWDNPKTKTKLHNLIAEDRAHFVAPADYQDGSQLDVIIRGILGRVARDAGFRG